MAQKVFREDPRAPQGTQNVAQRRPSGPQGSHKVGQRTASGPLGDPTGRSKWSLWTPVGPLGTPMGAQLNSEGKGLKIERSKTAKFIANTDENANSTFCKNEVDHRK